MTVPPQAITITPRPLAAKLRYLAAYLAASGDVDPVAVTLQVLADEVAEDGWDAARDRATEANAARRGERERIIRLAEQHGARAWDKPGESWSPSRPAARRIPFADLLREQP